VYERFGGFDTRFGTSGDYELMLRLLYKEGVGVRYLPEVTVLMRTGGASNVSVSNRLRANSNDRLAWKLNGLKPRPWTLFLKPLSKIPQYIIYPWLYGRYFKPRITD
jgi:glycosyltransferase